MSSNDWGSRIARGAESAMKAEAKGMGAIALYVRDDLAPYLGVREQEGALKFRADSDESVKACMLDVMQAAGVDSVKGLDKGSNAHIARRNAQAFIRRAVNLYRACVTLADRHGEGVMWGDGSKAPRFPLAWFMRDGATLIRGERVATHVPMSGKQVIMVHVLKPVMVEGEEEMRSDVLRVTVSEASILAAAFPPTKRGAQEDGAKDDAGTMQGAVNALATRLARDDYSVTADAVDAFEALLKAFIAASPSNLAFVAGIVDEAQRESESKVA